MDETLAKEIPIEENMLHKVSEVICINCKCRWIGVRPTNTLLKDLECPQCRQQGYVVETGEVINENKHNVN